MRKIAYKTGTEAVESPTTRATGKYTVPQLPANPIPAAARSKRASKAEVQQRVLLATQMLIDGRRKHEIKRFFNSQYGVGARQTEVYLALARARLAESDGVDLAQMRCEFFARYMRIFREAESDASKIAALRAAGALYGLEAPHKIAQTTSDGRDVGTMRQAVQGLTIEELRTLRNIRDRMRQVGSGNDGSGN